MRVALECLKIPPGHKLQKSYLASLSQLGASAYSLRESVYD